MDALSYNFMHMNRLNKERRVAVTRCLVEGNSIRSTVQITGVAKNTVTNLLVDLGSSCSEYQDTALRNLKCDRVQCDETLSFVGCEETNLSRGEQKLSERISTWTWTAIDVDTKLMITWLVGDRNVETAFLFMNDVTERLSHPVQLTTDHKRLYLGTVDETFDYSMLFNLHGFELQVGRAYDLMIGADTKNITTIVSLDEEHVATSNIERQNLMMKMGDRPFKSLTKAFGKKVENYSCAIALHFMHYNFGRKHQNLKTSPAVAAGIAEHIWTIEEIAGLLDSN